VMVKVLVGPSQMIVPFSKCGVTTRVAMIGAVPVLTAVKKAIFPAPLAANPIPGVSFDQEYVGVPPVLTVLKDTAVVGLLLQTT
jgi:hypothetical protein